jgi:uncharacterized protein (TIGR02453 family)
MKKKLPTALPESIFPFLKVLNNNNNREWFQAHKSLYTECHEGMIAFADDLLSEMNKHDSLETPSGKKSLYRIYKDVRFSKDKTPYKTNWAGGFHREGKLLRGSYYYHIEEGNSYVSGGFYGPNPGDLARIRQEIDMNYTEFRSVLKRKEKIFGKMRGDCLKLAPSGYPVSHPAIELLRYKQFILRHSFTDKEVKSKEFTYLLSDAFKHMRPFLDFMSEVLTTDANGTPV